MDLAKVVSGKENSVSLLQKLVLNLRSHCPDTLTSQSALRVSR